MTEISSFQKKPKIQLITVDSDKKIFHFNGCKLIINTIGNCLLMEPKSKNVKVYVANFEKSYYRFKNILCILDSQDNIYNFIIILRSEESCEKTFNPIQKRKEVKDINLSNAKLFQQLLCPILNGIQPNKTSKAELTPILITLFKSFTEEEKIKCREYLKEIEMEFLSEFFDNTVAQPEKVNNKRKRTLRNRESVDESVDGINVEGDVQPTKSKHICNLLDNNSENYASDSSDIIKSTNFNVITFPNNCFERKKLFVFPENDKSKRYEYYWDNRRNAFVCCGCARMKKCVTTKIFKENEQECINLKKSMHICEPKPYNRNRYSSNQNVAISEKRNDPNFNGCDLVAAKKKHQRMKKPNVPTINQIIEEPNYEFIESRKIVIIFPLNGDKNNCYEYLWSKNRKKYECRGCRSKNKTVGAELCENEDGKQYIKLGLQIHICDYQKYNPEKYFLEKIVEAADFEIIYFKENKISKVLLFIFADAEKSKGFEFYRKSSAKFFVCGECEHKNKYTAVKVQERKDGTKFARYMSSQHICEPKPYDPNRYSSRQNAVIPEKDRTERIIEYPNFVIIEKNRLTQKTLFIFANAEKTKCYEFYFYKQSNISRCLSCKNKITSAKIEKNDDGSEFIRLISPVHVCEVRDYNPDKYIFDPAKQIVVKPNFEIFNFTRNGTSKSTLIVFCPTNKELCYEYSWSENGKYYVCLECANFRHVTAKFCENLTGEDFVKLSHTEHVCDLQPFNPEKFSKEQR